MDPVGALAYLKFKLRMPHMFIRNTSHRYIKKDPEISKLETI